MLSQHSDSFNTHIKFIIFFYTKVTYCIFNYIITFKNCVNYYDFDIHLELSVLKLQNTETKRRIWNLIAPLFLCHQQENILCFNFVVPCFVPWIHSAHRFCHNGWVKPSLATKNYSYVHTSNMKYDICFLKKQKNVWVFLSVWAVGVGHNLTPLFWRALLQRRPHPPPVTGWISPGSAISFLAGREQMGLDFYGELAPRKDFVRL